MSVKDSGPIDLKLVVGPNKTGQNRQSVCRIKRWGPTDLELVVGPQKTGKHRQKTTQAGGMLDTDAEPQRAAVGGGPQPDKCGTPKK